MVDQPLHSQSAIQRITFDVCDVPVATKLLKAQSTQRVFEKLLGGSVEACSQAQKGLIGTARQHAFLATLHTAFALHYPLVISPDHIWLLICQGFSKHVNANAEALRDRFVRHQGRLVLRVIRPDFVKGSPHNRWQEVFPEFSRQIQENLLGDIHGVLTTPFSTTTAVEQAAFEISLMETFQAYFEYIVSLCGIPSITLEGSPEDWRSLLERTRRLSQYDLDWWVQALIPILEELVRTSEGLINTAFWESFYKHDRESGGPHITGWIIKFFPYIDGERNPCLADQARSRFVIGDAGSGMSFASFKLESLEKSYQYQFAAGFAGMLQQSSTMALRPEIGWAVIAKDNLPDWLFNLP